MAACAALLSCALFAVLLACALSSSSASDSSSLAMKGGGGRGLSRAEESEPFAALARCYLKAALLRDGGSKAAGHKSGVARMCSEAAIEKALIKLASTQGALKSLDGLTHQFRNTLKDSSSLNARFHKFCRGDKKNLKEATKLYEYVNVVERSLQCVEILSAVEMEDGADREAALAHAGLAEVRRVRIEHNKLQCTLSVLLPQSRGGGPVTSGEGGADNAPVKYEEGEVILAVVDALPPPYNIKQILRVMAEDTDSAELMSVGLVKEEVTIQPTLLQLCAQALASVGDLLLAPPSGSAVEQPRSVRVLGHSAGGAVGAYAALVLDGSLNLTHPALAGSRQYFGLYSRRVSCVSLGPPPCVGRSVVGRCVVSIVCGDDMVPRSSPAALAAFRARVWGAVSSTYGVSSWVKDLAAVGSRGLGQYTGGSHDLEQLSLPGRAFFVKSRSLKDGASIQRVLRGNWQEDMLWLLHEVLVSKRMLEHHSMAAHFKALSRC